MTKRLPFEEIRALDRLVHDPSRLGILMALSMCRQADFVSLLSLTGLTKGNLSTHLTKLERGKLITITKGYRGRVPRTTVDLKAAGREALRAHWKRLEQLWRAAKAWRPAEEVG